MLLKVFAIYSKLSITILINTRELGNKCTFNNSLLKCCFAIAEELYSVSDSYHSFKPNKLAIKVLQAL